MKRILATAAVAALSAFSAPAFAQSITGMGMDDLQFYARLDAGVSLPGVIRVDGSVGTAGFPAFSGTISFDAGPALGLSIGTHITDSIRAEFGIYAATNTARSHSFTFTGFGNVSGAATGSVQTVGAALTGFYDFTQLGDFVPYLDAGIAAVNVSTNNLVVAMSPTGTTSGSSTVAALRLGGGFRYNVTDNLTIGADYFALLGGRATFTYNDPANANVRTITSDVMGHSATVSLNLKF